MVLLKMMSHIVIYLYGKFSFLICGQGLIQDLLRVKRVAKKYFVRTDSSDIDNRVIAFFRKRATRFENHKKYFFIASLCPHFFFSNFVHLLSLTLFISTYSVMYYDLYTIQIKHSVSLLEISISNRFIVKDNCAVLQSYGKSFVYNFFSQF